MRHEVCNKALLHSLCVDPDRVGHENGVRLGPSLVLLQAWQSLDLDQVLDEQGFSTEQIATAKAVVLNRLIEPASEHELPNWLETTALGDLLGFHAEGWAEDRFYRINDKLLAAKTACRAAGARATSAQQGARSIQSRSDPSAL
jgi:hypothetical protein